MREAQTEIRSTMSVNTLESGSKLEGKNDPEKNAVKRSNSSNYKLFSLLVDSFECQSDLLQIVELNLIKSLIMFWNPTEIPRKEFLRIENYCI